MPPAPPRAVPAPRAASWVRPPVRRAAYATARRFSVGGRTVMETSKAAAAGWAGDWERRRCREPAPCAPTRSAAGDVRLLGGHGGVPATGRRGHGATGPRQKSAACPTTDG